MNFHNLNKKIEDSNNYKIIAKYIIENNISLNDFFDGMEVLNEQEGFFSKLGSNIDTWGKNIKNWWGDFRGSAYNIDSVIKILQKAEDYLKNDQEMQSKYRNEIRVLAKTISSIKEKSGVPVDKQMRLFDKETGEATPGSKSANNHNQAQPTNGSEKQLSLFDRDGNAPQNTTASPQKIDQYSVGGDYSKFGGVYGD